MASLHRYPRRNSWRIGYTLHINGGTKRKSKYCQSKTTAANMAKQIEFLELATRSGIARDLQIEGWIDRGWIDRDEAGAAFSGYQESADRKGLQSPDQITYATDYNLILNAFEDYSLRNGKGGERRINLKSHRNSMVMARQVIAWLTEEHPDLGTLTSEGVEAYLQALKDGGYASWSVRHYHTKLRLLLDRAAELGMIDGNPARRVATIQPKVIAKRVILSEEQARHLLDRSLEYRKPMSGCLPTVVRLGLYAGLRDEEMCWLKWDAIDFSNRIITVGAVVCEASGRTWVPKDHESRRLDVKKPFIDYLKRERARQKKARMLGPFVMPGGHWKATQYRGRPLNPAAPQKAFRQLIAAEEMDPKITVYSLRHTYATMALRSGVDLRTLQQRMGHADLKTTMEYLHYIEPEQHPMDRLPY